MFEIQPISAEKAEAILNGKAPTAGLRISAENAVQAALADLVPPGYEIRISAPEEGVVTFYLVAPNPACPLCGMRGRAIENDGSDPPVPCHAPGRLERAYPL
jgi:hypothetical protein